MLNKIVKPELCREIINAVSNPVIPRECYRIRRKKKSILVVPQLNLSFHPRLRLNPGLALNRLVTKRV